MNLREYSDRMDKLAEGTAAQVTEVLETAIKRLAEISGEFRHELAALSADFQGTPPPERYDTVAEAEGSSYHSHARHLRESERR